jgi:hypothetical protein
MRKIKLILIFSFFITFQVFPNKIKKAYDAFFIYDYFKAKKLAYSSLSKKQHLSSFLLASIYYRNDNPFHQLDSAYKYIELSNSVNWSESDIKFFKLKKQDTSLVSFLREKIHLQLFKQAFFSGNPFTVKETEAFLLNYPKIIFKQQIIFKRDSIVFYEALKEKSSVKMNLLQLEYPESFYKKQMQEQEEFFRYKEFVLDENPNKIERFIHQFPKSKYVANAQDDLFEIAMMTKNKGLLHRYIMLFPKHSSVEAAWKMLYSIEISNYSDNALSNFILKYPDFPYKISIERELALSKQNIFIIKQNEKFGCINELGDTIIPFIYDAIEPFKQGIALVEKDNFFGYLKLTGEAITNFEFDDAENFNEDRAVVNKKGHVYVIDRLGNTISSNYDVISDYNEGLAIVKKNNFYGAINKSGKIEIPIQYQRMGEFVNGMCFAQKNEVYGYIDKNGYTLVPFIFDWAENFKNGFARVKKDNRYGVINQDGQYVLLPYFDRIDEEENGIFMVFKNSLYGFFDNSGCSLSQINNTLIDGAEKKEYTDGNWMKIVSDEEQNLMNKNGKLLSEKSAFDEIYLPKNGLFRFMQEDKYGFLSLKNKITIKPIYDEAIDFNDSICIARKKNTQYIINTKGEILFQVKTTSLEKIAKDLFVYLSENNEKIYCNKSGNMLFSCKRENPTLLLNRFLIWDDTEQTCIYDLQLNKVIFGNL